MELTDRVDDPVIVVTADAHVGPSLEQLREHCSKQYLDEYDKFVAGVRAGPQLDFDKRAYGGFSNFGMSATAIAEAYQEEQRLVLRNAESRGSHDVEARHADMDYDGVAGELIFHGAYTPDGGMDPIPFVSGSGAPTFNGRWSERECELEREGRHIYNRWLADFVVSDPVRHAGICQIPVWDIDCSVSIVEWAAARGLKGVNFPAPQQSLPTFEDSYWDPLFARCQEIGVPLVLHAGGGRRIAPVEDYVGPAHYALLLHEISFAGGRAMWHLIFSGVFDRFPGLNLVFTEVPGTWYVSALREMDAIYDEMGHAGPTLRRFLKQRPSDYMRSNVFFGVSFMSRLEAHGTVEAGLVDRVMWGSDYPHSEGTWMYFDECDPDRTSVTKLALANAFAGLPADSIRKMAGLNAIECYRLDAAGLRDVARRVGPPMSELEVAPDPAAIPSDYTGLAFRQHGAYA